MNLIFKNFFHFNNENNQPLKELIYKLDIINCNKNMDYLENECQHFLLGNCKFGGRCYKTHPDICRIWNFNGTCSGNCTEGCHPKICRNFIKRRCRFGIKCHWYHSMSNRGIERNKSASEIEK